MDLDGRKSGHSFRFHFRRPVTPANAPVYGTQGTPSTANLPGNRYGASTWTDSNGNLWLLGGYGYDSTAPVATSTICGVLPTARTWTWVGGSNVVGANDSQFGVYGTQGTAAAGNLPGAESTPHHGPTTADGSGSSEDSAPALDRAHPISAI